MELLVVGRVLRLADARELGVQEFAVGVSKTDATRFSLGGRAWEYRGLAQIEAGNIDAALRDFDRALELDPWYWEIHANRAVARMRRGMWREALEDCDAALARNPGVAFVIRNREKVVNMQNSELENPALGLAGNAREDGSSAHGPGPLGSF